jgi:hypothetical protein
MIFPESNEITFIFIVFEFLICKSLILILNYTYRVKYFFVLVRFLAIISIILS